MSKNDLKTRTRLSMGELVDRVLGGVTPLQLATSSRALDLSELEEHILLSASPVMVVAELGDGAPADSMFAETATLDLETALFPQSDASGSGESSSENVTTDPSQVATRELVFLDTSIEDYQTLLNDLWANDDPSREIEVVLLQNSRDGVDQITEALAERSDLDAVDIVSHGTDSAVKLGSTWLSQDSLAGYAGELARWGHSLSGEADLLFYGCDLASSPDGEALLESIQLLTGADVAASIDDTGTTILGADWDLEYELGSLESAIAFSSTAQAEWFGTLDAAVLDATSVESDASAESDSPIDQTSGTNEDEEVEYLSSPLAFEENQGQTGEAVDFLARGSGYTVFLSDGDAVLSVTDGDSDYAVRLHLAGGDPATTVIGQNELGSRSNYLVGDSSEWQTDVTNFGQVRYSDVYEGIDVAYYGNQRQLEYDFIVEAGADAGQIQLNFDGAEAVYVDGNGELAILLSVEGDEIRFNAPYSYQETEASRQTVVSRYRINADGSVGFELGDYDASRELVIAPVLNYGAYLDSSDTDLGENLALAEMSDDAAAGSASVEPAPLNVAVTAVSQAYAPSSTGQSSFVVTTDPSQIVSHEVVFLDTSVDDYQQLLDDLWANADPAREFEVVLLDSSCDGIVQISEALAGRTDVDAVHIVSHGTDTAVKLGSTWLTAENLSGYAGEIACWSNSLTTDADLLFYGCDLAASADGQLLVDSLSALTGVDVAASDDDTGHAIFGADWDFEYTTGQIETSVAFSQDAQDNWGHLLNVAVDATSTGTTTGSSVTVSHTPPPLGTFASATGDATSGTVAVGSAASELVFGVVTVNTSINEDLNPGAGQSEQWDLFTGVESNGGASTEAGAASVDMSWTWTDSTGWAIGGISIKPVAPTVTTFQQGDGNGYSSTVDTFVDAGEPTTDKSNDVDVSVDLDDGAGDATTQGLIRFENIFGNGAGQIPAGSTINSASLTVNVNNVSVGGASVSLHEMLTSWVDTDTWTSTSSGISTNDIEAATATDSVLSNPTSSGLVTFSGLESRIQSWLDGASTNNDWVVVSDDDNGWDFDSSEHTTISQRPQLTVNFTAATNSAPAITLPGAAVSYTENELAVVIDGGAPLSDSDSADFDTGMLTVDFSAGGTTNDRLTIRNEGTGAGQIGISGSTVRYQGTTIGSFTGGTDGSTPLEDTATGAIAFTIGDVETAAGSLTVTATSDDQTISPATFALPENSANTTSVGTVVFSDPDVGDSRAFLITAGNTDAIFTIDAASGEITVTDNTNLDFETTTLYTLTLTVSDGVATSSSESVTINVTDENEAPISSISDAAAAVDAVTGNQPAASVVGITAFADDPDGTDSVSYSLDSVSYSLDNDAGGRFTIDSVSGVVITTGPLDAETATSHSITVRAMSDDGRFSTASYTIAIDDLDEFDVTPIADSDGLADAVDENSAAGTSVGITALASDADATTNGITYSLDDDAAGQFAIDGLLGEVTVLGAIDREAGATRNITVRATSDDGSVSTASYTIVINDLNDNAPVIGTRQTFSVSEFAADGVALGTATASDVDTVDLIQSWMITSGDSDGVFEIDAASGEIRVFDNTLLNFETTSSYVLGLTVQDGANTSATQTVAISVVDENDVPVLVTNLGVSVVEGASVTISSTELAVTDEDELPSQILFSVESPPAAGRLELTGNPGVSIGSFTQDDIDAGRLQYVHDRSEADDGFTFSVSDGSGGTIATTAFSITNLRVNDAPFNAVPTAQTVNEDSPLVFSSAGGNVISVSDVDLNGGMLGVRLVATNGTLTLSSITGLTFANGDGDSDTSMVFAGTIADVNAALDGLTFDPTTDYNGSATVRIVSRDMGSSGSGGEQIDDDTINITVDAVNDAPVAVDDDYSIDECNTLTVSAISGLLANDSDIDLDGLTVVSVTGTANGALLLNADGSFVYTPDLNFNGIDSFTYQATDDGGTTDDDDTTDTDDSTDTGTTTVDVTTGTIDSGVPGFGGTPTGGSGSEGDGTSDNSTDSENVSVSTAQYDGAMYVTAWRIDVRDRMTGRFIEDAGVVALTSTDVGSMVYMLEQTGFWTELDNFQQDVRNSAIEQGDWEELVVETTTVAGTTLTVGYIVWLLRSGSIVVGLVSSLPAWTMMDPLPVLESGLVGLADAEESDDDSLQGILKAHEDGRAPSEESFEN
jgi:hypothetical protein